MDQDPEEQGGCATCVLDYNWIGLWDLILMNQSEWLAQLTLAKKGLPRFVFLVSLPILPLGVSVIRKEAQETLTAPLVAITGTNKHSLEAKCLGRHRTSPNVEILMKKVLNCPDSPPLALGL